jgi:hypothetical protein
VSGVAWSPSVAQLCRHEGDLAVLRQASNREVQQVELHSESQSDRCVLEFRGPEGQAATVIVMRRRSRVWLVLNGAEKSTVAMTDPQAIELVEAVRAASR